MLRNLIFTPNNCIRHCTVNNYNNVINGTLQKAFLRYRTRTSSAKSASIISNDLKYSQDDTDKILETINSSDINNLSRLIQFIDIIAH